jgi:hypothetical protein
LSDCADSDDMEMIETRFFGAHFDNCIDFSAKGDNENILPDISLDVQEL